MPAANKKTAALPDAEIQALADQAFEVWSCGVPTETHDSRGDRWELEPIRDANMRLEVRRFRPVPPTEDGLPAGEELVGGTQVAAFEFGLEGTPALVASRVLAVASA